MRSPFVYVACSLLGLGLGLVTGLSLAKKTTAKAPPALKLATAATAAPGALSLRPPAEPVSAQPAARGIPAVIEAFLATDWADTVALISASGEVAAWSDASVRQAWALLLKRSWRRSHQETALSLYLWSRLARLEPGFPYPASWTLDANSEAFLAERVRQSMDALAARLRDRSPVGDVERRAFFAELIKKDARAALEFWFEVSNPLEHIGEISLFSELLRDPARRDSTLERLRAWSPEKNYVDELIVAMAQPWITADLAGTEAWIRAQTDPALQARLLTKLAVAQGSARPQDAFRWSEALPPDQRLAARAMSIHQLAHEDPAGGMILIDSVNDPAERTELIKAFGNTLALNDVESWLAWRDALPPAERDTANSTGFGAWAVHASADAAAWLKQQAPGQTRDQLAAELVRITAAHDTPTAITWINAIQNPNDRMMAISMALGNLTPGDTERMQAILRAAALTPSPGI